MSSSPPSGRTRLRSMLSARSVAVVGASDRADSFGRRLTTEALRSPGVERVHLVHPTRTSAFGRPCVPSLSDVPEPVDLVLLGVPDKALAPTLALASERGDAGAVVFGPVHGIKDDVIAAAGEMAIVGGGCMGFVDTTTGVRAIGYLERDPLPAGPIGLITHSGSVFSALLRTRRPLGYTLAVSSGQELVTTTADYLEYLLSLPQTQVIGLVLETMRDAPRLEAALADAAERDVPVCALTVGTSVRGRALVDAHSGAIAGSDAGWEALFTAYGVHRCGDLDDLTDSLEMFAIGRRHVPGTGRGIATAHDSGAERVLVADVAERLGVRFATLTETTKSRLAGALDPGLVPTNPLDVWGRGTDTAELFTECLSALADDPATGTVALAVDMVEEYDGDDSFAVALENLLTRTRKPVVALTHVTSAVDPVLAARLRASGIPVLEGTASGLRALGHLMAEPPRPRPPVSPDEERSSRWATRLRSEETLGAAARSALLSDYGLRVVPGRAVDTEAAAVAAGEQLGYPVVLKSDAADVHHKTEADGVRLGLADAGAVRAAYAELAGRLGPRVVVQRQASGVEVSLGMIRDPLLGPLVMVAAGGVLVELVADRAVALPPLDRETALAAVDRLAVSTLLDGYRGSAAVDRTALADALVALGQLAVELGDHLDAVDLNPVVVGPDAAYVVDALLLPRRP
ncbi:MAG TPA: acetate--CoA ligase family protein [Nocardioides sp.]|uniref:acetate--CoA ligase family protein n=1 Tax=Nocardioides sp. TaxID=35761 RepID=UPI002F4115FD